MNVPKREIQKLLGDENIDIIIKNCLDDKVPTKTIRISIINYILQRFFALPEPEELNEYPVSGRLGPVKIKREKDIHSYGYRKDLEDKGKGRRKY